MKILAASGLAVILAACAGSSLPAGSSHAVEPARSLTSKSGWQFTVLHAFRGNGPKLPWSTLTYLNGAFYGTTDDGGTGSCRHHHGCGTIYATSPQGKVTVIHDFQDDANGSYPVAGLTAYEGSLYGTTATGVIYSILPTGSDYQVLHTLSASQGFSPGGLIVLHGLLYGTTAGDVDYTKPCSSYTAGCGTVFAMTPSGQFTTLYRFKGVRDGDSPSDLVAFKGVLYGTTFAGGRSERCEDGCGTIFSMTTSGAKHTLYSFESGRDGHYPSNGGLALLNGTLYGTTEGGGEGCRPSAGCGTVFQVSTSGQYRVIYRFTGVSGDGAFPAAPLYALDGTLYGTTEGGGAQSGSSGNGTIFRTTPSGEESVLYAFQGLPPEPQTALTSLNGTLYGTTPFGGPNPHDIGMIFSLAPSSR